MLRKHKWQNLNESLFIDSCFFFPLTCFSLVTFPTNLAQILGSDRSTYLRNIFFHNFYTFEVMIHFVAEESFHNNYLTTLFEYNSWNLKYCSLLFCRALLTINSEVDIKFQPSTYCIMEAISLNSNGRKTLANQKGLYTNRDSLELFLQSQFSVASL